MPKMAKAFAWLFLVIAACSSEASHSTAPADRNARARSADLQTALTTPSSAEIAVTDSLLSRYPDSTRNRLQAILTERPGIAARLVLTDPNAQRLADNLVTLRAARRQAALVAMRSASDTLPHIPLIVTHASQVPIPGASAVLLRSRNGSAADVLVLADSNLTTEGLISAVHAIRGLRRLHGDSSAQDAQYGVRWRPKAAFSDAESALANAVLRGLQRAPEQQVPGVGLARAVRIWMPASTR